MHFPNGVMKEVLSGVMKQLLIVTPRKLSHPAPCAARASLRLPSSTKERRHAMHLLHVVTIALLVVLVILLLAV